MQLISIFIALRIFYITLIFQLLFSHSVSSLSPYTHDLKRNVGGFSPQLEINVKTLLRHLTYLS